MTSETLTLPQTIETKVSKNSFNPGWLQTLKSAYHFMRSLRYLQYHTTDDGAVTITHAITGSSVVYRADGNIDMQASRNMCLGTGNHLLLNCNPGMDFEDAR